MSFVTNFPLFCLILCLLCAAISVALRGDAARRLTALLCLLVAGMNLTLLFYVNQIGEAVTYLMGHVPHPWGNELRFGLLEPLFACVFALVLLCCVIGGKGQLQRDLKPSRQGLYFAMTDLVLASLMALSYTNDLFTGYVFLEISTIAACGILIVRQIGSTTLAAVRYMIFSLVGSGLFLIGFIILYHITGHLLMPNLNERIALLWESGDYHLPLMASMALLTVGLAIKSGLFPFHFWMPDTYGSATPASSGILSGLVSKGYILLLIKLVYSVFGSEVYYAAGMQNVLYVFGAMGIVFGSVSAMRENDVFRMIAYSSAAQIGYIYLGIGMSPTLGIAAALFHILTHAMTKPALFLAGAQLSATVGGRRRFRDLQGAGYANRFAGLSFTVGALSMIGIPLTMGFVSKYLFARAAIAADWMLIPTLLVLALSTVLNTCYFGRTLLRLYNRPEQAQPQRIVWRAQRGYALCAAALAAGNLALGIFSQPLIDFLARGLQLF